MGEEVPQQQDKGDWGGRHFSEGLRGGEQIAYRPADAPGSDQAGLAQRAFVYLFLFTFIYF